MPWSNRQKLTFAMAVLIVGVVAAQSPSPPVAPSPNPASPRQAQPIPPQSRPLLIMLDPAHGGSDPGATLNPAFPEKDVTLVVARRLRQELISRGLPVQLLRDSDASISTDQRAATVNAQRPALYIAIHATSQGSGIRVFTALLPAAQENLGPFLDWQAAQAFVLVRSRAIQNQIVLAMQKSSFAARDLVAPLRPLNNVLVPAIAIELAPADHDVSQLASPDYQAMVCTALAEAIAMAAPTLRAQAGGAR